jgi:hypothetical protein
MEGIQADDTSWAKRFWKRAQTISILKRSAIYANVAGINGLGDIQPLPNTHNKNIPKRKWDDLVIAYRKALRRRWGQHKGNKCEAVGTCHTSLCTDVSNSEKVAHVR